MKSRCIFLKHSLLGLALLPVAALRAQTPAIEDIPIEFRQVRNYTFSFGVRAAGSGGVKVKFGGLGSLVAPSFDATTPNIDRTYNDGYVDRDALGLGRSDETAAGTVTANGRYTRSTTTNVDANNVSVIAGDFLSYKEGQTRSWSVANINQIANGVVSFNSYNAVSNGGSAEADSKSSVGLEMAVSRTLGRIGKKTEWGISVEGGISDINSKFQGAVTANLQRLTDTYALLGALPALGTATSYTAPSSTTATTETTSGTVKTTTTTTTETTAPLGNVPLGRQITTTANGATVDGTWQIKGAAYALRVGPTIRTYLSERLAVSGGAGVSAYYIGARYRTQERFTPTTGLSEVSIDEEQTDEATSFGFYAEARVEFWPSERTGFFAGAAYESMTKDFEMAVGSRTADIEVGNGIAIRFGIVTRF